MMKRFLSFFVAFVCITVLSFAQDDMCNGGATPLTNLVPITAQDNGTASMDNDYSGQTGGCDFADYENSLWYSFMATSNNVEITITPTGITQPVIVIVDNCTVGLGYFNPNCDIDETDVTTQVLETCNLVMGTTYYVMVSSAATNAGTFDLVIDMTGNGVVNDICANATALTPDLSCTNTVTGTGDPNACDDPEATCQNGDPGVWYTFDVEANVPSFDITGSEFEVFTGTCGSLTQIGCNDQLGVTDVAATYYILVYNSGSFTAMSTSTTPVNDEICNAILVTDGNPSTGNNICADMEFGPSPCPGEIENQVWYTYTTGADAGVNIDIQLNNTGSGGSFFVGLYTIGDCATGTGAALFPNSTCDAENNMVSGVCLEPNTTYYIMVASAAADAGDFDITLTDNSFPLENDDCADVVALSNGAAANGTNLCANPDFSLATCSAEDENSVWYNYTTGADKSDLEVVILGNTNISETMATDISFSVLLDCGGTVYNDPNNEACEILGDGPTILACVEPNTTLFFQVTSSAANAGDFEITVTETVPAASVPLNDECTSAEPIPAGGGPVSGATDCASPDHNLCGGTSTDQDYQTVWYEYTVATDGVNLEINLTPNPTDPLLLALASVAVFEDCAGDLAEEYDLSGNSATVCGGGEVDLSCVPAGTYLIAVGTPLTGDGTFDLEVIETDAVPQNDLCADFIDAVANPSGTNICANGESMVGGCIPDATTSHDVWYSYTLTNAVADLTIDVTPFAGNGAGIGTFSVGVYADECGESPIDPTDATVGITCNVAGPMELGCVPDPTVWFVISSEDGEEGEFEINITEADALPPNDLCADADNANSPTLESNSCASGESDICGLDITTSHDVWYEYTLTNTTADITINVSGDGANGNAATDVSVGVYYDCALTPLNAIDLTEGIVCNTLDNDIELICVAGPTIFFVVASPDGNEGDFTVTVSEMNASPDNDLCADVASFPLTTGMTEEGTTGCASAELANPFCGVQSTHTVYYEYTVSSTTYTDLTINFATSTMETGTAAMDLTSVVWDDCSGATTVVDNFITTTNPLCDVLGAPIEMECVPPGTSFVIAVGSSANMDGDFSVMVIEDNSGVPTNDICSDATVITIADDCIFQTEAGDNTGACPEFDLAGAAISCPLDEDLVVWYEVTIPADAVGLSFEAFSAGLQLVLFNDCPVDGGGFFDPPNCMTGDTEVVGLTGGDTYYIAASLDFIAEGPFSFDIKRIVPPSNDLCDDAQDIFVGDTPGLNICATVDLQPTCTPTADDNMVNTVWFEYTVPVGVKQVTISVAPDAGATQPMMGDIYIAAIESPCSNNTLYQNGPISESCVGDDIILSCPDEGDVIQILVGTNAMNEGEFIITITEEDPGCTYTNDECMDAIPFTVADPIVTNDPAVCEPGCNELACPDPEMDAACGGVVNNVVWFTFNTDNFDDAIETFITASLDGFDPAVIDPVIQVFSGNCGGLVPLGPCANANTTGPISNMANPTIDPNMTYFVAVGNADPTLPGGLFDLCVEVTQGCVNDICDDAIELMDDVVFGTTTSSCTEDILTACNGTQLSDDASSWYTYVVPAGVVSFEVFITDWEGTPGEISIQWALEIDCNNPDPDFDIIFPAGPICDGDMQQLFQPCVIEDQVFTFQIATTDPGEDFDIRIEGYGPGEGPFPTPDNDLCDDPSTDFELNEDCEFVTFILDNIDACPEGLNGIPSDLGTSCDFDMDATVWFEFVLPVGAIGLQFDNFSNGTYIAIFDDNCPVGLPLDGDCIDDPVATPVLLGLTPGATYLIAAGNMNQSDNHTFEINAIVPPENDSPDTGNDNPPADLTGSGNYEGTTCCAIGFTDDDTQDFENVDCGALTDQNAVWHIYTATGLSDGLEFTASGGGGANVSIEIYEGDAAGPDLAMTLGSVCGGFEPIRLGCPDPDIVYWVKIGSSDADCGEYILRITEIEAICEYADNCSDITDQILMTAPTDTECGEFTVMSLEGCLDLACPAEEGIQCDNDMMPTVWIQVDIDDLAAQFITSIETDGSWTPIWSVWYGACDNLTQLPAVDSDNNTIPCGIGLDTYNAPVTLDPVTGDPITTFFVAISAFGEVDNPTFTLNAFTTDNCIVCLGIEGGCESVAEIEVMDRENDFLPLDPDGDGLAGPFCPGEKITIMVDFFYDASETGNDWIIGMIPTFGPGWDIPASDIPGQGIGGQWEWIAQDGGNCSPEITATMPALCTYTDDDGNLQILNVLCEGSSQCETGTPLPAGSPTPGGWYWLTPGGEAGCTNGCAPQENYGWNGTQHQVTFPLDLVIKEFATEEECNMNNSLQFSFQTVSDGVAGCYNLDPVGECKLDNKQIGPEWKVDCDFSPPAVANPEDVCSGDVANTLVTIEMVLPGTIILEVSDETSPNIIGQNGHTFTDFGNIPDVLENCSTIVDTARYIAYAIVDGFNCPGPPVMINIPVLPKILIEPPAIEVCLPFELNLDINNFVTGGQPPYTDVQWLFDGVPIATGNQLTGYNLTETGVLTIIITDSNGCMEQEDIPVVVFAELNPVLILDQPTACNDENGIVIVDVQLTQGGPATSYDWIVTNSSGQIFNLGNAVGSTYQINLFDNAPDVYTISVIVQNAFGCEGESAPVIFTLSPAPGGVIVPQMGQGCDNFTELCIAFYDTDGSDIYNNGPDSNNDGIPDLFDLDLDGVPEFLEVVWETPNGDVTTPDMCFTAFTEGFYSAFIITNNNCIGNINGVEVTFPSPEPPMFGDIGPICAGDIFELAITPTNYDSYSWEDGDGNSIGGSTPSISIMPAVTTTYIVEVEDGDGCQSTASATVVVNPLPVISISGSTSICPGQMTVIDAGGDPQTWTYLWTDAGGNPIVGDTSSVVISTAGDITVVVTDGNGCMSTETVTIEVSEELMPTISGENICDNGMATLDAGTGFDTYEWIDVDGSTVIGDLQTIEVSAAGIYTVNVTQDQCSGSGVYTVAVIASPITDIVDELNVCNINSGNGPTSVDLTALASSSEPGTWSSLDGIDISTLTDVSFLGEAVGCYSFVYTTNNAMVPCANVSHTLMICVSDCQCPNPNVIDQTICNTIVSFNLNNQITATTDPGNWSFNTGPENLMIMNDSLIVTDGVAAGVYEFLYNLDPVPTGTCPINDTLFLTVLAPPVPTFDTTDPMCSDGSTSLDLSQVLLSGSGTWIDPMIPGLDFTQPNNLVFGNVAEGSYQINFVTDDAVSPCANQTFSIMVNVINCDCPILDLDPDPELCNDSGIFDLDTLIGSSAPGSWMAAGTNPGNANLIGTEVNLTGEVAGLYIFIYTLDNPLVDCPDSDNVVITLYEAPEATAMNASVCNTDTGNGPTSIDLTTLVDGDAGIWTDINGVELVDPTLVDFDEEPIGSTFDFIYTTNIAQDPPCSNISVTVTITVTDCECDNPTFVNPPVLCNVEGNNIDLQTEVYQSGPVGSWSITSQPTGASVNLEGGSVFNASDVMAGEYTLLFTLDVDPGGNCQREFNVMLTIVDQLVAVVKTADEICTTDTNGEETNYDLTSAIESGEAGGVWTDQNGMTVSDPTAVPFLEEAPGDYVFTYTVTNSEPCEDVSYMITLTARDCACPSVTTASPGTYCNTGGTIELLVDFTITNEPGQWYYEDGTIIENNIIDYTNLEPGDYGIFYLIDNAIDDCEDSSTQSFTIVGPPDLGQAIESRVCANEEDIIDLSALLPDANCDDGFWEDVSIDSPTTGAFDTNNGTFSTAGQMPAEYRFQFNCNSDAPCDQVSEVVSVIIEAIPNVDAGENQLLTCDNNTAELGNTAGTSLGSNFTYEWTEASGNVIVDPTAPTIEVTEQGVYTLVVTDMNTLCQVMDIVQVDVDSGLPVLTVDKVDIDCFGANNGMIMITATGGIGNIVYSIDGGTSFGNLSEISGLSPGQYDIVIRDDNGCEKQASIEIIEPPVLSVDLGLDIAIETGASDTLTYLTNSDLIDITSVEWSVDGGEVLCQGDNTDCSSIIVSPNTNTTYCITIINSNGCIAEDCIQLRATVVEDVYIPNVFSPNDDGNNDWFFVQTDELVTKIPQFYIFDRWGELVYTGDPAMVPNVPSEGWDGTLNGRNVVPGVYVYMIEVEYLSGETEIFGGDITVFR